MKDEKVTEVQKQAVEKLAKQAEKQAELSCEPGKEHWRTDGPPTRGGILTWATGNFSHLDPTGVSRAGTGQGQIFNSLMEKRGCFYEDTVLKGSLAKSWESKDAQTWTVKLRDDVVWQNLPPVNGRKFTSADVVWNANFHVTEKTRYRSYYDGVDVSAPDDYTVVFKLKAPDPDYMWKCCFYTTKLVAHEIFDADGDFKTNAVGTGAWMVDKVELNSEVRLKPNPDYYEMGKDGKPLPYMDQVRSLVLPDYASWVASLRAGKLDVPGFSGILAQDVPSLKECCPQLQFAVQNRHSNSSLWFNLDKEPWNDFRVRKAAQLSINREDIVASYEGQAGHAGYMPPGFKEFLPPQEKLIEMFKQDVPAALALMKEAGYGPDNPVTATIRTGSTYATQAEVVQQHLAAIGINASVEVIGRGFTPILQEHQKEGNLDLGWGNLGSVFFPGYWMGDVIKTGSSQNFPGLSDSKIDELAAAQSRETDPAKRALIFTQIQERLYELIPWVPTVGGHYQRIIGCRVKNMPLYQHNHNSYFVVTAWLNDNGC